MSIIDQVHSRALEAAERYRRDEAALIDIIQEVEKHLVFLKRKHASLFAYVTTELKLGEHTALSLIAIARKAREVPELKVRMANGSLTLSNARRVASVITPENQKEWLEKATTLSQKRLEKEIVRVRPGEAVQEKASYVTAERVRLEVGLWERSMLELRHAQDLLSQAKQRPVSLEETLETLTREFIRRNDPIERAKRQTVRKPVPKNAALTGAPISPTTPKCPTTPVNALGARRVRVPAAVLHQVRLRDQGRCTQILSSGRRCNHRRWIETHHKVPVSQGGPDTLENLVTLCNAHHRAAHL